MARAFASDHRVSCRADAGLRHAGPHATAERTPAGAELAGRSLPGPVPGASRLDDGSQNLVGALKTCMGTVGAMTIKEMQKTEIIIAPSIKTEGKLFQKAQQIGMGKF